MDRQARACRDDRRCELSRRFDGWDRRFVQLEAELRRLGVLIEQGRHELQGIAEMVVANTEATADLGIRLDTR
jgi:hypothetical protein